MIRLSEIDEFHEQVAVDHDIVRLQVQMNDLVVSEVPQGLDDGEHDREFGHEGDVLAVGLLKITEVVERDVVQNDAVGEGIGVVDGDVVLRQEYRAS